MSFIVSYDFLTCCKIFIEVQKNDRQLIHKLWAANNFHFTILGLGSYNGHQSGDLTQASLGDIDFGMIGIPCMHLWL